MPSLWVAPQWTVSPERRALEPGYSAKAGSMSRRSSAPEILALVERRERAHVEPALVAQVRAPSPSGRRPAPARGLTPGDAKGMLAGGPQPKSTANGGQPGRR